MTTIQIVMLCMLVFCTWMGIEDTKKQKQRLHFFYEKAIVLEMFIQECDRNNQAQADASLRMLENLKQSSFCKKTERIIDNVEAFWKAMFLHLYR